MSDEILEQVERMREAGHSWCSDDNFDWLCRLAIAQRRYILLVKSPSTNLLQLCDATRDLQALEEQ